MRTTYIAACVIAVLVVLWLASGQFDEPPPVPAQSIAVQNARAEAMREDRALTRVRVATIHASLQDRVLLVRGRTQSKRSVIVQSQIAGILAARPVERGERVTPGQLLCRISIEDRDASLKESVAALNQARIEFEGSQRLSRNGLQSETAIAKARARLASAEVELLRSELNKSRLNIIAPFEGVVEAVHLEEGQYVVPGSQCVTLVDLDPMLLIGNVPEAELRYFYPGLMATANLPTGQSLTGKVTFVAKTADEATRTYPIEIHIRNEDFSIPSGISAQINIPVESVVSQKISPALLTLDDRGEIGVRTVDPGNVVRFHPVEIISDEADGIWVSGLPDVARIITVGQQLVVAGETVNPIHEALKLVSVDEPKGDKTL